MRSLQQLAVTYVKPRVGSVTWQKMRRAGTSVTGPVVGAGRGKAAVKTSAAPGPLPLDEWDLTDLARHFGTDKWGPHRFAAHYGRHFATFKKETFTLFEIGIGGYAKEGEGGASLRMWKAFFPNAYIVGLDLQDKSFVDAPRIRTYRGSQTNAPLLKTIVSEAKNLRIVVDDGSHRPEHIRETFSVVFPLLPAGSLYAIEDTQTSYWPRYGGSLDLDDPTTTLGMVRRLVDGLNYEEWQDADHPATATDRNVVAVHCYHNLIIIEKGPNSEGTNRGSGDRAKP